MSLDFNNLTVIYKGTFFNLKLSLKTLSIYNNALKQTPVGDLYSLDPELFLNICSNGQLINQFFDKDNCLNVKKLKQIWEGKYALKPSDCFGDKPPENSADKLKFFHSYFLIYISYF